MKTNYRNSKKNSALEKKGIILLETGRILLGCVFVFSGFVKAIDPLGSTYKFNDYFNAFGGFFELFTAISFPLAILLSTLELIIGLSLLLKVYMRLTSFVALLFMAVMTSVTLYSALYNPVSDCGCFGDALVISNWATFYKNVVLIILALFMVMFHKRFHAFFMPKAQTVAVTIFVLFGVGLSAYCYRHLPLIDFLPYKTGVNIPAAMLVPQDAPSDEYLTTFIYQKNGVEKEFTLENYPKGDSTWKFVDQKSVLISEGYKAPIHDFSIVNMEFDDITEDVLYNPGSTYLLIIYDLSKASDEGARKAEQIYQKALRSGTGFYALTASSDEEVLQFKGKNKLTYPFCKTDPTTLKTIIRANPGLILIKNGTITGKWNWRDFE